MPRLLVPAVVVLALLALPAVGQAATVRAVVVTVEEDDGGFTREDLSRTSYGVVRFVAGSRERNRLTLRTVAPGRLLIRDSGARLRPSGSCTRRTPQTVVCRVPRRLDVTVRADLGPRADRLVTSSRLDFDLSVDGGSGDDVLAGGRGDDFLGGGSGRDVLLGGAGDDRLEGGAGSDRVRGGTGGDDLRGGAGRDDLRGGAGRDALTGTDGRTPASDRLDGGAGDDALDYATATRPMVLRSSGTAGVAGETDRHVRIESLQGGRAGDRLIGDRRANAFVAASGDTVEAGAGDDEIDAHPQGTGVDVSCGAGRDVVKPGFPDASLILERPDCEDAAGLAYGPRAVRPDALDLEVGCAPARFPGPPVVVRLSPAAFWLPAGLVPDAVVGEAPQPTGQGGARCRVTVPLNPMGVALLAERRSLPLTASGGPSFVASL